MIKTTIITILFLLSFISAFPQTNRISRNLSYGFGLESGNLIPGDKFGKDLIRKNGFGSLVFNVTYRADSASSTPYDLSFGYPGIEAGIVASPVPAVSTHPA